MTPAMLLLLLQSVAADIPVAGRAYEITRSYSTQEQDTDGSTSSANGRDTIVERVLAVREDGVELEYDLPADAQARAAQWQLPVRVFRPTAGPVRLLDREVMVARVDAWLAQAKLPRSTCGKWYFTWNAFRAECDPDSALEIVAGFDLGADTLRAGDLYKPPGAAGPAKLKEAEAGLTVEAPIDGAAVRRARAESDVVVAEISREPLTLEAAVRARADEVITGTVSSRFELDDAARAVKRTSVTTTRTRRGEAIEKSSSTEVLERRPLPRG